MTEKHTDSTKYNDSPQKNAKREVKYLTRSIVPDTIFSNKQQATSNKRHKNPLRSNKFTIKYKFSHSTPHAQEQIPILVRFLNYTFNKTASG